MEKIYRTEDGSEFCNKKDALAHEKSLEHSLVENMVMSIDSLIRGKRNDLPKNYEILYHFSISELETIKSFIRSFR